MKKKLDKLTNRVVSVSCEVLFAFPQRVETRNQTFTVFMFFSFSPRHYSTNNIQVKSQLLLRGYLKKKIAKALEKKL